MAVISGALLVASTSTGPWYSIEASFWSYSVYLITYLIILIAIPMIAAMRTGGNPHGRSLRALAGPSIIAAIFASVAAVMLPASEGFLQSNFQLNTALILILSYSWIGLAGYLTGSMINVFRER